MPAQHSRYKTSPEVEALLKLEVGDSFQFASNIGNVSAEQMAAHVATAKRRQPQWRFAIRRIDNVSHRVWRTA